MENTTMEPQQQTAPVLDAGKNKFAIAGFILGICGLALAWFIPIIAIAAGIVGIVMSVKGKNSEKKTFAVLGLIFSIAAIPAGIICWIVKAVLAFAAIGAGLSSVSSALSVLG